MRETGTVVEFFEQRGFGFVRPLGDGSDLFVHVSAIPDRQALRVGQRVSYMRTTSGKDARGFERQAAVDVQLEG
jgi:cold shock CspA family protein